MNNGKGEGSYLPLHFHIGACRCLPTHPSLRELQWSLRSATSFSSLRCALTCPSPPFLPADSGVPEAAICVVTTAAIDVHRPNISSDLFTVEVPMRLSSTGTSASITSGSASRSTVSSGTQACSESSQTLGSSPDCSAACEDAAGASPRADLVSSQQRVAQAVVQELLSSLSEEARLAQKGLDPVNLKLPSPAGSVRASPELSHRLSVYNRRNQENLEVFQLKPLIDSPQGPSVIEDKYGALGPPEPRLSKVPEA